MYRLEVDNITQALLAKFQAGVPVRLIVDPGQYTNPRLAGVLADAREHRQAVGGGRPDPAAQPRGRHAHEDAGHVELRHERVVELRGRTGSAITTTSCRPPPSRRSIRRFNDQSTRCGTTRRTSVRWSRRRRARRICEPGAWRDRRRDEHARSCGTRAAWAVSYDVYLGTSPSSMSLVANVPAQMVEEPADDVFVDAAVAARGEHELLLEGRLEDQRDASRSDDDRVDVAADLHDRGGSGGGALPSPWLHQDVGSVGVAGSASFSSGVFTVAGAGSDIWGAADSFHFAYQSFAGDGQIVARVDQPAEHERQRKGGPDVPKLAVVDRGERHHRRPARRKHRVHVAHERRRIDGLARGRDDPVPAWLKLVRSGSTVTGFVSADGSTWTTVGSTSVALGSTASVGLAVTSHNTGQLNTATFDSVAVTASGGGTAPGHPRRRRRQAAQRASARVRR